MKIEKINQAIQGAQNKTYSMQMRQNNAVKGMDIIEQRSILCKSQRYGSRLLYYTKPPECVEIGLSTVHNEVFTAGALEARVRRTSAFRAPVGKTE